MAHLFLFLLLYWILAIASFRIRARGSMRVALAKAPPRRGKRWVEIAATISLRPLLFALVSSILLLIAWGVFQT